MKKATRHIFFILFVFVISIIVCQVTGCGGGGNSNVSEDVSDNVAEEVSDNDSSDVPGGKMLVDGHVINPDFLTPGKDFYVNVSYFDQDGKLTSYHEIFEWQGTEPTYANDYLYTYNSNDDVVLREEEETYTREGHQFYIHEFSRKDYEYDDNARLSTEFTRVVKADYSGNGIYDDKPSDTIVKVVTYTYDDNGNLKTVTIDFDGDGQNSSSDTTTTYEYDVNNNPIKESIDNNMWVEIRINEFDTNGLKTKQTIYATDTKFSSGEKKSVTTYTYNSNGDIVLEKIDNGVYHSSNHTPDGIPDDIIEYRYGNNGEIVEKIKEQVTLSSTRRDVVKYLHEVTDGDGDGVPEVTTVYVFWLDTVYYDTEIPPESLPAWYVNALTDLNNGNDDDGWGLNWDGHDTGTCSTCGNMQGQVNKILLGF